MANNKPPRSDNNRGGYNQINTTSSSNYNKLSTRHKNNSVPAGLSRSISTPNHQSLSTNPSFENFHRQTIAIDNAKKIPNKANRRQFVNKVEGRQVDIFLLTIDKYNCHGCVLHLLNLNSKTITTVL